ncbi:DUF4861 family protein [Pontiella agarivorans]|uniref:DUF4861 family protein n=1 Tax=Pontiella agarivorans TaxID=3038953 RepID=A0ABU5MYB4_9BACT|nr:DUF4861 family protein [Pontiella agarivorans]MDZ8119182.1 DUF4861 family protein [Pontiella agarivorans]
MKKILIISLAALSGALLPACAESQEPETFCRYVPERSDDFAWENDKIAFRMYGPTFRKGREDSGIDCWLKRVDYPVIDKWYGQMKEKTYHRDWGEGYDPYHVGSSRGCGGLGLWIDGRLITSNVYREWRVIKCEPAESVFVLSYAWEHDGDVYTEEKQISIKLGDRLFKSTSTFRKNGEIAAGLPIAVGLTTHDGKAAVSENTEEGWMACWETIDGDGLGTGVVMDPSRIDEFKPVNSDRKDESHALLITKTDRNGQVEYWAGYGWERAGEIKTSNDWNAYLKGFNRGK